MREKMTLRKIAAALGVSQVTVLRALSGRPGVSPELRKKIQRFASLNHYRLPDHRTGNVAMVVPGGVVSGYLAMLIWHLQQELRRKGFCSYIITESDIGNISDFLFDGLFCTVWNAGFEKRFPRDHALPVVCINAKSNCLENIHKVAMDETQGVRTGMELLYRSGCRRIAFWVPPDPSEENVCRAERVKAYCDFCREHDIYDGGLLPVWTPGGRLEEDMARAAGLGADGVFHANEDNAFRLLECLRKLGKSIPGDIAVLGLEWDGHSEFMNPPLTTLRQDFGRLAEEGVKMLTKLMNKEKITKDIRIPYQLIERASIRRAEG